MQSIMNSFPISSAEYDQLEVQFGKLCHHQSWQLLRKNVNNNCADDREDMLQEIRIAVLRAGSYYKRQTYIESCFLALDEYMKDAFGKLILEGLKLLWLNRTRHGASRQKFGEFQEIILERLVKKHVPKDQRPWRQRPLEIDAKFRTYCNQISWNQQKLLGKRITKDKQIRSGMVSLSEYEFLCPN